MDDVGEDEWNHPPATDQVISIDPLTLSVTVGLGGVKMHLRMALFVSVGGHLDPRSSK